MATPIARRWSLVCTRFAPFGFPIAAALLLFGNLSQAQEPKAAPKAQTPEQRIEVALCDSTNLEFVETPLQDVIDFLKDVHKIEIQLDSQALDAASIGSDTPITRNLKNITLAAALKHVLAPLGLTYVVRDEVLLITTPEAARGMVDVRVYKVGDLVLGDDAPALAATLQRALTGVSPDATRLQTATSNSSLSGTSSAAAAASNQNRSPAPCTAENIVSIEPFHDVLIVRANYHGHKATEKLLSDLSSKRSAATTFSPPAIGPGKTTSQAR